MNPARIAARSVCSMYSIMTRTSYASMITHAYGASAVAYDVRAWRASLMNKLSFSRASVGSIP